MNYYNNEAMIMQGTVFFFFCASKNCVHKITLIHGPLLLWNFQQRHPFLFSSHQIRINKSYKHNGLACIVMLLGNAVTKDRIAVLECIRVKMRFCFGLFVSAEILFTWLSMYSRESPRDVEVL